MTIRCKDCGCVSTVLSSGGGDCEICRHMTNHNDPIDRALERLAMRWPTTQKQFAREVLTDLAAEIRAMDRAEITALHEELDRAYARLAAVVEACEQIIADRATYENGRVQENAETAAEILTVIRGEGRKGDEA